MDLLEIKKQHVSAYHWPSSGLILNNGVRVLYNYCKRALVLGSHRLRVWLDIAYPTSIKSWTLSRCGISPQVVRCGLSWAPWYTIYPLP